MASYKAGPGRLPCLHGIPVCSSLFPRRSGPHPAFNWGCSLLTLRGWEGAVERMWLGPAVTALFTRNAINDGGPKAPKASLPNWGVRPTNLRVFPGNIFSGQPSLVIADLYHPPASPLARSRTMTTSRVLSLVLLVLLKWQKGH